MCMYVCLRVLIACEQNISKSYERILIKSRGEVGGSPGSKLLDFGGNPYFLPLADRA